MTWRITRNFLFRNRHPISCCSGFRLRRPLRYTSSQHASLKPILVKMSIARSGIAVTRISFLQIDISAIASYFHNTLCDCLLLASTNPAQQIILFSIIPGEWESKGSMIEHELLVMPMLCLVALLNMFQYQL